MTNKTSNNFQAAIMEGILKSQNQWIEPVTPEEPQPGNDYNALNRVFHEIGAEIIEFSKHTTKIGHEIDPNLGGHIDLAEQTQKAGKFQLVLIHMQEETRRIPVAILQTSEKGFPVSLTWPRPNPHDHDTITAYNDEHLATAIKKMVSEYYFGCALKTIMEHVPSNEPKVVIH
ncbi:hypothetical protein [Rhizobium sp. MHM7A]|uniref:hypothetical protein n=1 Tax=Rhizobium sp. MHM7A TaxID=2583233 RepID=UPI001107522B|nr:hypothetical protein [Rhizobium sp. MHM7A]TLX15934.1 hypothetical protein FFR93_01055 [Rhizobium sp. MHM7A]